MHKELLHLTAHAGLLATLVTLVAVGGLVVPLRSVIAWLPQDVQAAATFLVPSITVEQIQREYNEADVVDPNARVSRARSAAQKVRVLVVPGHQPDTGGAEFKDVRERDLVVEIANALAELLAQNPNYEVIVARGSTAWNPVLQRYFEKNETAIIKFHQSQAAEMAEQVAEGSVLLSADQVYHNKASSQGTIQLYGINKWSSENYVDIALHLHLNDYAGRRGSQVGRYDGFAVYVPDHQYSNAAVSKQIGIAIANRLSAFHATSTLPREDVGVVEDQELIAIGSNNTADNAALLIEYGYIFEPQFTNPSVRSLAVADYAYQTYLGLQDFFKDPIGSTYGSVAFPYDWNQVVITEGASGPGVYALQAALRYLGHYPPAGRSFSECPVSGVAGACTEAALAGYQKAKGLEAVGRLGPQTQAQLEEDLATLTR